MRGSDELADIARAMLAFRRIRPQELPNGLFSETGWEFLLELFIADADGERLTGHMVVERSGTTDASASRWLMHLSAEGLVIGDGSGDLDDTLTLAPSALGHIESLMTQGIVLIQQLAATERPQGIDGVS